MSFWDDVGDALEFEQFQLGDWWEQIKEDPERIFIGAIDPISSDVWGFALGKDYEPMINQWGGATNKRFVRFEEEGGNAEPAMFMHDTAKSIAKSYAAAYAGGAGADYGESAGWYDSSVTPYVEQGLQGMIQEGLDPTPPAEDDPDFGGAEGFSKKKQMAVPTFGLPEATQQAPPDPDVPGAVRVVHDPHGEVVPPDPDVVPTFGRV